MASQYTSSKKQQVTACLSTKPLTFSRFEPIQKELQQCFLTIIEEFVTKLWFSSISFNTDFQYQLLTLISHITYGLEERLVKVDWNQVFFGDVPYILKQHYNAYEQSKSSILSHLYQSSSPVSIDMIYHSFIPHVAMVDSQSEQEYLRCFLDHTLKLLCPSYLSEADLERILYREILTHLMEFLWNTLSEPEFLIPWITYLITPSRVPSKRETLPWWKRIQLRILQLWQQLQLVYQTFLLLMHRKPTMNQLDLPILQMLSPILPNSKSLHFGVHVWYSWIRTPLRFLLGPILDAYLEASLHQWLCVSNVATWIHELHHLLKTNLSSLASLSSLSNEKESLKKLSGLNLGLLNEKFQLEVMENKYRNKHVLFLFLDLFIWHLFPEFLDRLTIDLVPKKKPSHNVTKTTVTGITAKKVLLHRKSKSSGSI